MLRRIGLVFGLGAVALTMLAYAAAVLPVLPWWSWLVSVAGVVVIRRWARLRRQGPERVPDPDALRFAPVRGGGK